MKILHVLRSRKGMTLMELMITMSVLLILIPTISLCLSSAMRQYAWTKSYSDMCAVVSVIDGTIARELSLASGLEKDGAAIVFFKNGIQARRIETKPDNGDGTIHILYIDEAAAFDVAFYKDVSVTAEFDIQTDGAVLVKLTYQGVSTFESVFVVERITA